MARKHDKRLKKLAQDLNHARHEQAKKIDILCNDMVSAHSDFIKHLQTLTFGVNFYESIIGQTDLSSLLNSATDLICQTVRDANVAVFLLATGNFELHMADDNPIGFDTDQIESYFTQDIVHNISRANRICDLDDLHKIGLQGNMSMLSKLSIAAIPIGRYSSPAGFILVYRGAENKLTADELRRVDAITPGLCSAIHSACRVKKTVASK